MALTPEKRAYYDAKFGRGRSRPKPSPKPAKVVASEGRIVRDVEVQVSPADFNFPGSRGGFVRIDYVEYERQRAFAEADAERERARRKALDPFDYGHWNKD
jgi:hypothetical protein